MSPTKTTVTKGKFLHSKESLTGESFFLAPRDVMELFDISKSTLIARENKLKIVSQRNPKFNGCRQYNDDELVRIADATKGTRVIKDSFGTSIIGRTGNTAFISKK